MIKLGLILLAILVFELWRVLWPYGYFIIAVGWGYIKYKRLKKSS